jgi:Peptidase family S41
LCEIFSLHLSEREGRLILKHASCWIWATAAAILWASTCGAIAQPSIDGHWLSDGYGFYADKRGDTITLKQVTKVSCLPAFTAKRESAGKTGEVFISRDANSEGGGPAIFKAFAVKSDLHLLFEGAVSDVVFRRTASPPTACNKPTDNTPQSNYAVFWQNYADHYPFFALRNTNWAETDARVRPTVSAKTTAAVLFAKLKAMFAPFNDAHTFINAPNLKAGYGGGRPGLYPRRDPDDARILKVLTKNYLKLPLQFYCNKQLQYGVLKDGTGYLRIVSFYNYIPDARFGLQAAALEKALDSIMADAKNRKGLIIDVRTNPGGSDIFGNIIAGRLTDKSYLAYRKVVRNDLDDKGGRTLPQDVMVTASSSQVFLGKVVLLTGNDSESAAETFAMALLGRASRVIRVGQPTQGVFSDILTRKLPNGWTFGLPNEIYLTQDGRAFDGPGLLPDVPTAVFSNADLSQGKDSAVEAAQNILIARASTK